ncbi:MAG: sulfatase-like hydrolase/transferase [Pseudomonadota bacterium]
MLTRMFASGLRLECHHLTTVSLRSAFQIRALAATLTLLFSMPAWAEDITNSDQPNIVIVLADDTGYSDLGSYGGEIDTPNLDALAAGGMRFSNFYSNGRCSPSRASLLTGLGSAKVGFGAGTLSTWAEERKLPAYRARLPFDVPVLPELLKRAGYRTFMAGKWHLGGSLLKDKLASRAQWRELHPGWELTEAEVDADYNALPLQRGFDEFFGILTGETHQFLVPADAAPSPMRGTTLDDHRYYEGNRRATLRAHQKYLIRAYSDAAAVYPYHQANGLTTNAWYAPDGTTDRALDMINQALALKEPFFLYLSYQSPHKPLQAPGELVAKYENYYRSPTLASLRRAFNLSLENLFPLSEAIAGTPSIVRRHWYTIPEEQLIQRAIHAAMTENLDSNVGRVMSRIKASGQWDNTFFVFLSDNGAACDGMELFNSPYRGCKALLWEGGIKVPLIVSWPHKISPGTVAHDVGWIGDLFTTSLSIASAEHPDEFRGTPTPELEGRDLLGILTGKGAHDRSPSENSAHADTGSSRTLMFNDRGQQAVRKNEWKLLINPGWFSPSSTQSFEPRYELYDLSKDPLERKNVAAGMPAKVRELSSEAETWRNEQRIVDYELLVHQDP